MSYIALIFLSGQMCDPTLQDDLGLPIEFISFAIFKGHIYYDESVDDTFILESTRSTVDAVYGGLFLLQDDDFYMPVIDAYNLCSMSVLRKNHIKDRQHRITHSITPISFDTVEQLRRLDYWEREDIEAVIYVGNPNHPNTRRLSRVRSGAKLVSGVHTKPFLSLLEEVII